MIFSNFRFRLWNRSPTGNDQSKRTIVFQVPLWSVHPGVVQEKGHVERLQDQGRQGGGQVTGTTQRSGVPLPKEESNALWRQLVPGTKQDLQSSADRVESVQRRWKKKPNLDEFRPGCDGCERVRPRKPRWYRKRDRFNKRRRWGGGRTTVWWRRTPPPPSGDGGHKTGPGHSQIRGVWCCFWTWDEIPEPATHNVLRLRGGSPHRCHCSQKVFGCGHPQILGVSGGHLRHTAPSQPWGHVIKSRDQIQSRGFGPGLRQCRRGIVIKAARALAALTVQFLCTNTWVCDRDWLTEVSSEGCGWWVVGGGRGSDWLLWSSRTGGQEQFYRPQWLRLK